MSPADIAAADDPAPVRALIAIDPSAEAVLYDAALRAGADAVLHELDALALGRRGLGTDTPRIEVRLQCHPVFARRDHAYLAIISAGHPAYEGDKRFKYVLPDGSRFCTMGAGPKNMNPLFGTLVSDLNRVWDVNQLLPDTYDAMIQHPGVTRGEITEREAVEYLFAADRAYADETDYDMVPFSWSGGYNSNSYIAGLLAAAGWEAKKPPRVPGWTKPLPREAFGIRSDTP
ncbi:hypothetical protein [Parvularcula oceani]|uniref:hypothetical protein n=1 Tax=Parvularcula oceani TaxID=1247963 RepID=UPI0004E101C1|nr:hypothetical protein [Parvularcula oceani]